MDAPGLPLRKSGRQLQDLSVRPFRRDDWRDTWKIIEPVLRAGDTYSFPRDISEAQAFTIWVEVPEATFVAVDDAGEILGTYYLKPNQPGQGSHVCNCGYIVRTLARGRGIASVLCEHSQREAVRRGYRAMQFNLVVATNTDAVRVWQKHGFEIAGTLPGAFLHPTEGYVHGYVMYKQLAA